ncbi:MAG: hypothetical protein HYW15_01435 [Candidatus Giovannonibacteria bacterium]|nr:MAG: hypothetical protein HYW15_01435 [Candidatus Giovannonibacteria bacterium]
MKYDVVVPFAFGLPSELGSNEEILKRAALLGKESGLPVFAECVFSTKYPEVQLAQSDGCYSSTLKLVKALADRAKKRGWRNVLVVAQPHHAKRCIRDLGRFGFNAEADCHFCVNGMYLYDKKSLQWQTRSAWQFWLREAPLRLLPWWLYSRIAG